MAFCIYFATPSIRTIKVVKMGTILFNVKERSAVESGKLFPSPGWKQTSQ